MSAIRGNVFAALGLAPAGGVDVEGGLTATGAATFRTGTRSADGGFVSVGVMVRLEGDEAGQRVRVTVRSNNGVVAAAVKDVFKGQMT